MKGPSTLEDRAASLVKQLTEKIDDRHGMGSMSAAVYDTAWLAMISKTADGSNSWLFPQCFEYVLDSQEGEGGWPSYASAIDGILNTAASLLCLMKHHASQLQSDNISRADLSGRIDRGKLALQRVLDDWDVSSTVHVGFEVLVPALLEYLRLEGISFTFPQVETLHRIHQQKLRKFKPEYLYGKAQLTALHSLESLIGKVDFDKLSHHKVGGSFMASPSSTAAYLMNVSEWDDECEDYLSQVLENGAGRGSGGIPSAWPSTTFETTWLVSTLLDADINLASIVPESTSQFVQYLQRSIESGKGVTGFAPGLGADADDTAKSIFILNSLGRLSSPAELVKQFEDETCFKTYPLERDPSFSANVNCLIALLHAPEPESWAPQILKIIDFLCSRYEKSGVRLQDKWNISPYYSMMLLAQALSRTLRMASTGTISALRKAEIKQRIHQALNDILEVTLQSCNPDGSWGEKQLREETAYGAIALASAYQAIVLPDRADEVQQTLRRSRQFLFDTPASGIEYLWVEKVTFGSELLTEAYVLAALSLVSKMLPGGSDGMAEVRSTNGAHSNMPAEFANGLNAVVSGQIGAVDHASQRVSGSIENGSTNGHHRNDSFMNGDSSLQANDTQPKLERVPDLWTEDNEKILLGPYSYLDKNPGKDIRGAFIAAFNAWLQVPADRLARISKIIRMLHTSSLLVDDIEDHSDLRRGIPVAHSIFGIPQTFNSANYVYFQALQEVRDLRNHEAMDMFVEELINLHRGQGMDLYWRDSLTCPTEQQYLDMVSNKTGGLFRLAIRLMQAESTTGRDLTPLVSLLGLQFQICDDYLNLRSMAYTSKKGFCEDLTEGKFSFPVIHSIHADPSNKELLGILKQKSHDVEIKRYAVEYMERTGSFEYTRGQVAELKDKIMHLIDGYESSWGDASAVRELVSRLDISQ